VHKNGHKTPIITKKRIGGSIAASFKEQFCLKRKLAMALKNKVASHYVGVSKEMARGKAEKSSSSHL